MFKLTVKTDNAAFEDNAQAELRRILQEIARTLNGLDDSGKVYDINGNHVGDWHWS